MDEFGYTIARSVRSTTQPAPDTLERADDWMDSADCAEYPTEMFYPAKGGGTSDAKRICNGCGVRMQCLTATMRAEDADYHRYGVFGGLSPKERAQLNASGWVPGQPVPVVIGGAGACPECGKSCRNVDRHIAAKHADGLEEAS